MVFFHTAHQNANADSFSVVYDLLNTAALFNLYDDVKNMVEHGTSTLNRSGRIRSGHRHGS